MTQRPRVAAITPLLVVSDLQRAIDFYCGKLGFGEPVVHGDPPCFAMMNRDGLDLMLNLAGDAQQVRPHGAYGVWDVYINVVDLAAELDALQAAGVALHGEVRDTFYQMREAEVVDPDNHLVCFGQPTTGALWRVAETWEGVLDVGAAKLRLRLKVAPSNDGLVARLDSLDQGANNIVIDRVAREGDAFRFSIAAIDARFTGTIAGDARTIAGEWSQRGRTWPLVWHRALTATVG